MARGRGAADEIDDEPLPWLEPADDDDDGSTFVSSRRLLIGAAALLGLVVLVVALVYAMAARPEDDGVVVAAGDVPLVEAPDGPFRTRPDDAGGMSIEGLGDTSHVAAGGVDPGSQIALDRLPEQPMARPAAPELEVALATPSPASPGAPGAPDVPGVAPEAAEPTPAPIPGGPGAPTLAAEPVADEPGSLALQLGAFSSAAKANEAWKSFSGRYTYIAGLEKAVTPLKRDGKTLYRLRATGLASSAQAQDLCGRLKVAGEACVVAD